MSAVVVITKRSRSKQVPRKPGQPWGYQAGVGCSSVRCVPREDRAVHAWGLLGAIGPAYCRESSVFTSEEVRYAQ